MTPPLAAHRAHLLPKLGHRAEEAEDAAAGPRAADGSVRAAVADGATESAYAGAWARALADAAADAPLAAALPSARARFAEEAAPRAEGPRPWYAEAKEAEGAHATLLALALLPDGRWEAEAVGDAVLFHLRGGALLRAWPLDDPAAFSNRPPLLSSRPDAPPPPPESTGGGWQPGDRFLLATDALAAYLLAHDPAAVADLAPPAFAAFVAAARAGGLRNDDVALIDLLLG